MISRYVTIFGYVLVLLAGVVIELLATWNQAQIPSLGQVLTRVMRTRTGRVGVLVAWVWLGLHFFAR